ncbi:MAG: D-2-hydroxyacid dehydrogenase [Prevotella sp.]|nr:D-2-hydroxyacid dehydrogenase [Prevotella sp.]MCM1075162.1 D-2-hydroxyacid dehydrogenase [Ruminococcus sp.]
MNIVVLDGYTSNPGLFSWEGFEKLGNLIVYDDTPDPADVAERCKDADIVLTNKRELTNADLDRLPRLKYVGIMATGCNRINLEEARRRGIVVTNVPAYSSESVAQLAVALLLNVIYHPGTYTPEAKRKAWNGEYEDLGRPFFELADKQLGIVGFGNIGRCMAKICAAFGMTVATDSSKPQEMLPPGTLKMSRDELFRTSDVISIHTPLTEQTRGMINRRLISLMKPTAVIINTSRGALIDEQALADALKEGRIYGAGLDVLSVEPPTPNNPLLTAPNTVITPHIGWDTTEARRRLMDVTLSNIESWLSGGSANVVN